MKPTWRKVLRDLWDNKARSLLVVLSIAVGVFAVGVIAGAYGIISADLKTSYESINPANITLTTDPFPTDFAAAIERTAGVARAEGRREVMVRVRVADSGVGWDELTLVAIPDFEMAGINRLLPIAGQAAPRDREVVLEQKTLASLGIALGSELQIELGDGAAREIPVVGAVQDPSDAYGSVLGDLKGYVTFDMLEWLHEPLSLNQLLVTVAEQPNDKGHIRVVAQAVSDRLERTGRSVYRTHLAGRDEHPLGSIVKALLGVLGLMGVLIVFLSSSLIANTMSALLQQHLRQIGVMKLVGATRRQIMLMYIAMIQAFALVALAVAIPLGSGAAYGFAQFIANVINFPLQGYRPVGVAVALQILIGLAVPPAAGIWPVLGGAQVTVQRAIAGAVTSGKSATGWLDRVVHRLRWVPRPLIISLRNTFRRKRRLALTLLTLTLGGAVFIAVFSARGALDRKVAQTTQYFRADVNVTLSQPYRVERVQEVLLALDGVTKVEAWSSASAELLGPDGTVLDAVAILAPPADSVLVEPVLREGRWLTLGDENAIAVSDAFWEDFPLLSAGDTLRLKLGDDERDWVVVGIFQSTGADQLMAYATYEYVADLQGLGRRATLLRVQAERHTLSYQEKVGAAIDRRLDELDYAVRQVEPGNALAASIASQLGILTTVLMLMALLTALVGSIGLAGTMSMNVMERTREIGILRAIGADNRVVAGLVIVEGLLIGLISYGLGALFSLPIASALTQIISQAIFHSPAAFELAWQGFALWFGVVAALSVLASLLPARGATRLTIREVLAYE